MSSASRVPKAATKNRIHLDVRLEAGIVDRRGERVEHGWGPLPWRTYRDPSGNDFCVLPART